MMLVRVAISDRSLREILPPTWKYFWTDDCVLRGLQVAKMLAM